MLCSTLLALAWLLLRKKRRLRKASSSLSGRRWSFQRRRSLILLSERLAKCRKRKEKREKRARRWWVRPLLLYHDEYGAWATTIPIMKKDDPEKFYQYFRMTPNCFDWLLDIITPFLLKNSWRKAVSPGERLAITLKFLASGDTFVSLEGYFLVAEKTISNMVFETTAVIWNALKPIVFEPLTTKLWLKVAAGFEVLWNLPHCVGSIDGKHVRVHAPPCSGSLFCNYKHFFSFILLAICDAKKKLLVIDVGSSGRRGDGNVFHRSQFAKKLLNKDLNLPNPCLSDGIGERVPFYFVGDAAFERGSNIVTPFKGKFLSHEKKSFNYRVSRGRQTIEDVFGILYKMFEIFQRPIQTSLSHAKSIVLCACALYNLHMMDEESAEPCRRNRPGNYADYVKKDGTTVFGRIKNEDPALEELVFERLELEVEAAEEEEGQQQSLSGAALTDSLIDYFIENDLPWQWKSAGISQ